MDVTFVKVGHGRVLRAELVATEEEKQELRGRLAEVGSDTVFLELTERYWTNGWLITSGDTLGQMTECMVIAEDGTHEDDGTITLCGQVWTNIDDYQITCPVETMLERGFVEFGLWLDCEDGQNFFNPALEVGV